MGPQPHKRRRGAALRTLVGAFLLLAAAWLPGSALGQTLSVTSPDLGIVGAAASGTTNITFSTAGAIQVSGTGGRAKNAPASARITLTIQCTNQQPKYCQGNNVWVQVGTTGSTTGRAQPLQNFTMTLDTGASSAGMTVVTAAAPVSSTSTRMQIGPIGKDKFAVIRIGATLPISGDETAGALGTAAAPFYVGTADANGANTVQSGGQVTATVHRRLAMQKYSDLNFGKLIRPLSTDGVVTLQPGGQRTVTSGVWPTFPIPSRAQFEVTGERGKVLSITVDPSFTMNRVGGGGSITVNTISGAAAGPTLGTTTGAYSFYVGGSFPLQTTTPGGSYTGVFNVKAEYN